MAKRVEWRSRYVETVEARAADIEEHPKNPKIHGAKQNEPLKALLDEIGKIDSLKAYRSERAGGKLVYWDGHGRRNLRPDEVWRVDVYDLTESEADLVVASFDPIGWLATQSREHLDSLLRDVGTGSADLQALLQEQAEKVGLYKEAYGLIAESSANGNGYGGNGHSNGHSGNGDGPVASAEKYPLAIVVDRQTLNRWREIKEELGEARDSEAFKTLLANYE